MKRYWVSPPTGGNGYEVMADRIKHEPSATLLILKDVVVSVIPTTYLVYELQDNPIFSIELRSDKDTYWSDIDEIYQFILKNGDFPYSQYHYFQWAKIIINNKQYFILNTK